MCCNRGVKHVLKPHIDTNPNRTINTRLGGVAWRGLDWIESNWSRMQVA
jgi:hypothetical protein